MRVGIDESASPYTLWESVSTGSGIPYQRLKGGNHCSLFISNEARRLEFSGGPWAVFPVNLPLPCCCCCCLQGINWELNAYSYKDIMGASELSRVLSRSKPEPRAA